MVDLGRSHLFSGLSTPKYSGFSAEKDTLPRRLGSCSDPTELAVEGCLSAETERNRSRKLSLSQYRQKL